MPRHSVRNSISRPFLPIKHALVRSKTERGISSDSPSIQLARALLESALKDEDYTYNNNEEEDHEHDTNLHYTGANDGISPEGNGKPTKHHTHSRKAKSLDLSSMMISRPTRLQRASSSSDASASHNLPDEYHDNADATKSHTKNQGSKITSSSHNDGSCHAIQNPTRPRSKSVSVVSHASPTPSVVLTTITESSEEALPPDPSSSPSTPSTAHAHHRRTSTASGRSTQGNRSRAGSLAMIPESEREKNTQATVSSTSTRSTTPPERRKGISDTPNPTADESPIQKIAGDEHEEEDWEVLSLRKRRKSSKYQPSSSSIVRALLGSPTTTPTPSNALTSSSHPASTSLGKDAASAAASGAIPTRHRRTTSLRALTSHLARPLPRYRRASANDAVEAKQAASTSSKKMQSNVNLDNYIIREVLRTSPSTNLDVWSEHLRKVIDHAASNTSIEHESTAADDSGLAPSLHEQSTCSSSVTASPPRHNGTQEQAQADGDLPRIPIVTLVSPMGTLRKYISCPDGILSSSPVKKHRPLPPLPDAQPSSTTVPTSEEFSPALPPLKRFVPIIPSSPIIEHNTQHSQFTSTPSTEGRKRSVRRKSVVNNLRSIRQTESGISDASASKTHCKTSTETTIASNLDSFKTARSSLSSPNLWPPPEELFASLFSGTTSPSIAQSPRFSTDTSSTKKRVLFSPSFRASPVFESSKENRRLSESTSYVYDPNALNARTPLQLLPRDLNTDLEVKPWMVVMPRFVLDDLAVGVRDWDKDKLEVVQQAKMKARQRSV